MIDELECSAYISGRQAEAILLGNMQDQQTLIDAMASDACGADDRIRCLERQLRQLLDAIGSDALAAEITLAETLLRSC